MQDSIGYKEGCSALQRLSACAQKGVLLTARLAGILRRSSEHILLRKAGVPDHFSVPQISSILL